MVCLGSFYQSYGAPAMAMGPQRAAEPAGSVGEPGHGDSGPAPERAES